MLTSKAKLSANVATTFVFDWPEMSESDLTGRGDPSHQSDRITSVLIGGNKKPNELIPLVKALHIEN